MRLIFVCDLVVTGLYAIIAALAILGQDWLTLASWLVASVVGFAYAVYFREKPR